MISTFPPSNQSLHVAAQQRRRRVVWALWFMGMLGVTLLLGLTMLREGPSPSQLSWVILVGLAALVVYQPRYGVYMLIGLSLVGDKELLYWYPFTKNFSSRESLLYLSDSISFSPLELFIVLTMISWVGRELAQRRYSFYRGPLFWPAIAFIAFITFALIRGLQLGGNQVVALWEVRGMYYIPAMLVLTSNLITRREHVRTLFWLVLGALSIESLFGVWFTVVELGWDITQVNEIADHSTSIHTNTLFVLLMASLLYRGLLPERTTILTVLPVLLIAYLANQRRAAFITLIIAILFVLAVLYWERRTAFWLIAPGLLLFGAVYVAAFWNVDNVLGLPAQAVRSVIASDEGSEDYRSNQYRLIENINTMFTIEQNPLFGTGFGKKFIMRRRLPDISFFIWYEYITHNSVLWIWMNAGVGGFISMLYMIGSALIVGMRAFMRMPRDFMSAVTLTAILYIIMHFVFAYVDMSWGAENMLYIGMMMGLLNIAERIVENQPQPAPRRWPWQPEPQPLPGLRPS